MAVGAFFDFDDTLMRGNSGLRNIMHYFFALRMNPLFGFSIAYSYLKDYLIKRDPDSFFSNVYGFMKDRSIDVEAIYCRDYYERKLRKRVYEDAKKLVRWHKKRGHVVAVVTNSLDIMVEGIRSQLGIDHILASSLEVREGVITGRTKTLNFGRHKVRSIMKFAKEHDIDLKASYAYSDNNSDILMLSEVGNPVAVNPMRKMRRFALKHEWRILNLR
jgi:HAD superfamily hydrolase (TIGR01490 family)